MKLTNKSEGGLTLNNVTAYSLTFTPKSSLVFPNSHLLKDYHKVLDIFKDILDIDLSIEQEETKVTEQPKKVEEVNDSVDNAETIENAIEEGEEEKVAKSKKATKKDK
nr:MAG TPA: hypothetical protein [Caudoviricetes sp.]